MKKSQWAGAAGAVLVVAAVAAGVAAGTDLGTDAGTAPADRGAVGAAPSFTRIAFDEAVLIGPAGDGTAARHVEMHVEHLDGAVRTLRVVTTSAGKVTEERLWEAGRPETITVRDWRSCRAVTEETPQPRPSRVDVITDELFGPVAVPPAARREPDGTRRWSTTAGLVTTAYADAGGRYPDRRVTIKGPDGQIGSVITGTRLDRAGALPAWRPGWQDCRPAGTA
ncbi:hypothetical protein AB0E83_07565 [Streptomyces sp. NPDC035033]|uniref:hypothetical protein n=1 Tax=Streptomyces sp. NPDC035033 TaxID=3155368 RepID=UPI0033FC4677